MPKDWDRGFGAATDGAVLTPADIATVLQAGVDAVIDGVQSVVRTTAENPTGQLEKSITAQIYPRVSGGKAVMGWDEAPIPQNRKRGYVDGRGRARKVDTVDDYARILEYSERRQLRHMEVGYDAVSDIAEKRMEEAADALLAKMARDAGL
ncbi:MAG: hypothetical protein IJ438_01145 [Clostridia bacterium]|nr:hypothetical protein [Clostridia bacterium]MBQ8554411.1 hypothetical protein [Clostridia bacterium]MBQ8554454.1 hypothetical protein [Clostridia bacterium]